MKEGNATRTVRNIGNGSNFTHRVLPDSPFSASSAPLRWVYVVDAEDVGLRSSEFDELFGEVVARQ